LAQEWNISGFEASQREGHQQYPRSEFEYLC
jgi:hypothetical protein